MRSSGLALLMLFRSLVSEEFSPEFKTFMRTHNIEHRIVEMQGTKKVAITETVMNSIMALVLDKKNHPLLIHCNHGKVMSSFLSIARDHADSFPASDRLRCGCHTSRFWLGGRPDRGRISRSCRTEGPGMRYHLHYQLSDVETRSNIFEGKYSLWL
jgi:hypothetical protein